MSLPILRFKEFGGGWKSIRLGKITTTLTSGSRDWAKYYSKAGSKFIRMTNLSRDGIQLKLDDLKFVDIESNSADGKRTSLAHGDILISITAELGKIGWIPQDFGEAFINQHTALVRLDNTKADSRFVAHLLSTPKLNKAINRMNDSGAKAGLNLPTIKAININLPVKDEQTKIANFLTAVDEKITQLTKKCDLLAQYKKGAMQQIFSQELRFKADNGQDYPDWEEKKLGEVGIFVGGGTPSTKNKDWWDGDIPWVSSSDLSDENIYQINATRFITKEAVSQSATKLVPPNSILIVSRVGVGKVAITTRDICTSQDFSNLVLHSGNHIFFAYLIKIKTKKLLEFNQGTSIKGFVKSDLESLEIAVPTLEEQTKIANFLKAIDEKITQTQSQLNAVKQYKQGLLQQMFV